MGSVGAMSDGSHERYFSQSREIPESMSQKELRKSTCKRPSRECHLSIIGGLDHPWATQQFKYKKYEREM